MVGLNKKGHIGNVNADFDETIGQGCNVQGVVQVSGGGGVDGNDAL
jgi:hypothetical protein